jgi:hypothetical protein
LNAGSRLDCVLNIVAAADLGCSGASRGEFFAGTGGFSVCGGAETAGRDVSIFNVLAFCPDNLRLLTEAASLVAVVGRGVISGSIGCAGCSSGTEGKAPDGGGGGRAGSALEGAGIAGGECSGNDLWFGGCMTSATVESEVPPVVLCEETELWYAEKPLESDCRGNEDLVCRSKSKPSSMYSLVISSSKRSSSSASSLSINSALSRTCGNVSLCS